MVVLRGLVAALGAATTGALDLALPASCSGCGREGEPLCRGCIVALDVRLELPGGVPIGMPVDLPVGILQLEWCAPFAGPVRAALHDLKYRGERRLAWQLGQAVARRWRRVGQGATMVVPVPVHAERERHRGYDQAALIAAVAAAELGLPYARLLERARATTAQFELGREERAANVAGAFRVVGHGRGGGGGSGGRGATPAGGSGTGATLAGQWVLLVDDVVTTGATLAACAVALEGAGAAAVSAITVARER